MENLRYGAGRTGNGVTSSRIRPKSSATRPTKRDPGTSNHRPVASAGRNRYTKQTTSLHDEDAYRRMDDELQVKTAALVSEADKVLSKQESLFVGKAEMENDNDKEQPTKDIDTDDFNRLQIDTDITLDEILKRIGTAAAETTSQEPSHETEDLRASPAKIIHDEETVTSPPDQKSPRWPSSRGPTPVAASPHSPQNRIRPKTTAGVGGRPTSSGKRKPNNRRAISGIDTQGDAVLEAALAGQMGEEVTIRLLKAKLKVMQEEVTDLTEQAKESISNSNSLQSEATKIRTENTKLSKKVQNLTTENTKLKQDHASLKKDYEAQEMQTKQAVKELNQLRRSQKQADSKTSAMEVRMRRAQDEAESLKVELHNLRRGKRDSQSGASREKVETLEKQNQVLVSQNKDLLIAFKKQLKLIEILKRQKLHVQAARVLNFSEEEFVKAMEWA